MLLIKYCHMDIYPVLFKYTVKLQESTVLELLYKQIIKTREKKKLWDDFSMFRVAPNLQKSPFSPDDEPLPCFLKCFQ